VQKEFAGLCELQNLVDELSYKSNNTQSFSDTSVISISSSEESETSSQFYQLEGSFSLNDDSHTEDNKQSPTNRDDLLSKVSSLNTTVSTLKNQVDDFEEENSALQEEVYTLKAEVVQLRETNNELETYISMNASKVYSDDDEEDS